MSFTEEDAELRELVVNTLESNGVLGKIKAQLRASVFLTLHEEEKKNPLENDNLNVFSESTEGNQVISLFKEFLKFYNLDYTLSVFEPETNTPDRLSRETLAKELNIIDSGEVSKRPLICEVLKRGAKPMMSFEKDEHFDLDKILTEKARKRFAQERKPSTNGVDRKNFIIENPRRKNSDEVDGSSASSLKISSFDMNKRRDAKSPESTNNNSLVPSGSQRGGRGLKSQGGTDDDYDEDIEEDIDEDGSSTSGSDSILKDEEAVTSDRTISSVDHIAADGRTFDYVEEVLKT